MKFRVLYREFLFRLMDVELLSASAQGDSSGLLGQVGALLVFGSVLLAWGALAVGGEIRRAGAVSGIWSAERFLVSLTMLVAGVFALLNWESTFPDRRDALVLGPLPVRARTLFAAKVAASASALGVVLASLHCLSAFAWPVALAPAGSGVLGTLRFIAAFWIVMAASGAFLYCAVLVVQAGAAQLPRPWYLRMSSALQIGLFALFLGVFLLQPSGNAAWWPQYWFTGMLSELSGAFASQSHSVMPPLAQRAVAGLALVLALAAGAYVLSYFRTLRKIVEQPDVVAASRGGMWLPRFGTGHQTALAHFVIRTAMRSRSHRVILSFYLGGGFALVCIYLSIARDSMKLAGVDFLYGVNAPLMGATVVMLCAAWLGMRTVFALPLDLRANWIFRVTSALECAECAAAVRRVLLATAVFPVWAVSAAVLLWFWPWMPAAQHLIALALAGSVVADLSLRGFHKIPFTCSYLPGKSKVHLLFWFGVIPAIMLVHQAVDFERRAMASVAGYCWLIAVLAAAAVAARFAALESATRGEQKLEFEQAASDELIGLGL